MKLWFFIIISILCSPLVARSEIEQHKKECIRKIIQAKKQSHYPLERVIKTINGSDADSIAKVENAGEVIENDGIRYQLMHNGIKVHADCYYGKWMTDIIHALRGHHEPQEERVFFEVLQHIPKGATMLELGAYWCYYSLWFAKEIPGAKNYVIEPVSENLEVGKKNFVLNDKQAHFFQGYLGATPLNGFKGIKRMTVDEFMTDNKIEHVDILHSDIQGSEFDMLNSSSNAVKNRKIDYFFISTHGAKVHNRCRNFLLDNHYKIVAEHEGHESCSCDGLIVARRKELKGPEKIEIRKYPK